MALISGFAQAEATQSWFSRRHPAQDPSNIRQFAEIQLPAIGWGSNSGELKNIVDLKVESALAEVLKGGCNLLDTSPAYRHRRSQSSIGNALPRLLAKNVASRAELFITSHCGFVAMDRKEEELSEFFERKILKNSGLVEADFVAQAWSMHPGWIQQQLDLATDLSKIEHFDCLFLDAPELGLKIEGQSRWQAQLINAFASLEELVSQGRIGCWGIASLQGFFAVKQTEAPLSLKKLLQLARQAAGGESHLRMIQAPFSLAELGFLNDSEAGTPCLQQQIADSGLYFMGSLSLGQAQLCQDLPDYISETFADCSSDAQRALQFARSTPQVGSALVGMKTKEHIHENLALASLPCATEDVWRSLFG